MEAAEKAFARARVVDKGRERLSQLARMHAHMCQGLGQHRRAISILTEALDSDLSPDATVECLHLRGEQPTSNIKTAHESTMTARLRRRVPYILAWPPLHAGACYHGLGTHHAAVQVSRDMEPWQHHQSNPGDCPGNQMDHFLSIFKIYDRLCVQAHVITRWGAIARRWATTRAPSHWLPPASARTRARGSSSRSISARWRCTRAATRAGRWRTTAWTMTCTLCSRHASLPGSSGCVPAVVSGTT